MTCDIIIKYNGTSYKLDIGNDDISIPITYNIADIKDISTKTSSYSKTIVLPMSQNNIIVFGYISDLSNDNNTFNPTKKAECLVINDTFTVFEGFIQLKNIKYDYESGQHTLECNIFSDIKNLWSDISDKYITDLTLYSNFGAVTASNTSTIYSYSNIVSSWSRDYNAGVYFGMIDNGLNWVDTLQSSTASIINGNGASITDMYPLVYVKKVFDRIFREAGYTYTSNFLNSEIFKNILMTTVKGTQSVYFENSGSKMQVDVSNQLISNNYTTPGVNPLINNNMGSIKFNTVSYDPYNLFDTTNHKYISKGDLDKFIVYVDIEFNNLLYYDYIKFNIRRSKSSTNWVDVPSTYVDFGNYNYVQVNNPFLPGQMTGDIMFSVGSQTPAGWSYSIGATMSRLTGTFETDYISLDVNEELRVFVDRLNFYNSNTPYNKILSASLVNNSYVVTNIAKLLPSNFKQTDFISSIIKMFNLYVVKDKLLPTNYIIEPRDDYYNSGNVVKDWTLKLDLSNPIDVQVTSNTQKKTNLFTYKSDSDYYNKDYTGQTNKVFGEYRYDIDNDFIVDQNKIEINFAPTPLQFINVASSTQSMYIPFIKNDTSGKYNFQPRILFRTFNSNGTLGCFNWKLNGITQSRYPYIGYINDPLNPTYDLNWGQLEYAYHSYNQTSNNLFNTYYFDMMDDISDPSSKIMNAYFKLSPTDISNFKFNDLILLKLDGNDQYWRINSIQDYDTTSMQSTKVELVKTKYYQVGYVNKNKRTAPTPISVNASAVAVIYNQSISSSNRNSTGGNPNVVVIGQDNIITSPNVFGIGYNNYIV